MKCMELTGSLVRMLSHLAPLGLAAILRDGADRTATFWWDVGRAVPMVGSQLDSVTIGEAVREFAAKRSANSWLQATISRGPRAGVSLFSPRIKAAVTDDDRRTHAEERREWLRVRGVELSDLDQALLGGLGEPAWWRCNPRESRPDDGASRWEMKTRNKGEEFFSGRLVPLTRAVAARTAEGVMAGLTGTDVVDETANNPAESRTSTGLTTPGPVDSAVAYCALHGIAMLPTVRRVSGLSASPGMTPRDRVHPHRAFLPVFASPVTPRRFRSLVTSQEFEELGADLIADERSDVAGGPLIEQGVHAVLICEIRQEGSSSAPERQVLDGRVRVL